MLRILQRLRNLIGTIFLRQKKKQDKLRFDPNTRKKVLSPIDCTAAKKKGGETSFFFQKKLISTNTQNKGKFFLF